MQEIKFRAWNNKFKEFKFMSLINYLGGRGIMDDWTDSEHSVWEQYTGLKDKNGVEIYAGDIVKLYAEVYDTFGFEITKKETGKIVFNSGAFFISTDTENDPIYAYEDDFEVIGNIHENPELLEE
ncbi:putative phage protein (TIGR01671 family) [Leuconostoc mesenteroides]|uniref:YopX family protein n=1 Tax=Leuconostoc mesenteroides TaxID=1245 RepID=UPI001066B4E0|nr:YopX family protein [Leuconostoc mesenteroides]TDV88485.1 putative phage protein (TIGR01671 family) [Leuconostoc mesenteroides]